MSSKKKLFGRQRVFSDSQLPELTREQKSLSLRAPICKALSLEYLCVYRSTVYSYYQLGPCVLKHHIHIHVLLVHNDVYYLLLSDTYQWVCRLLLWLYAESTVNIITVWDNNFSYSYYTYNTIYV